MYTDVAESDSGTTAATRNRWRALRRNGRITRPTSSAPRTSAHSVHQYAAAHGDAVKVVTSNIWCSSARVTAA